MVPILPPRRMGLLQVASRLAASVHVERRLRHRIGARAIRRSPVICALRLRLTLLLHISQRVPDSRRATVSPVPALGRQ